MPEVWSVETEVTVVKTNIPRAVQEKTADLVSQQKCLDCKKQKEDGERYRRGCCSACYQASLRDIAQRIVTKTALMVTGRWLPRSKGGRPRRERGVA